MLQRLPTALVQVKLDNKSKSLLNEIRLIIYFLYQAKEITKKVYSNIMNSIKLLNRMNTIFMNSGNSNTSDLYRLLFYFSDETDFKRSYGYVTLLNLSIYYTWKNMKKSNKSNKFKISTPTRNDKFKFSNESYSVSDIEDYFKYILEKD